MSSILTRLRAHVDRRMDRIGILISCLCAVHCVAGILAVTALGVGGSALLHPSIHRVGLVIATLVAAVSIGVGAVRYRRRAPFVVATTGLAFMGGALAAGHGTEEMVFTVIGVALVAAGHVLNLRRA